MVDLEKHPRLKRYRVYPELTQKEKLLVPDIKGEANIVHEPGQYYPHHNLYYITSSEWDLGALQAVLRSGIARLFVGVYSTQMRGGYLRYQAQYLRRIRLPRWADVPDDLKERLKKAGGVNSEELNQLIFQLYKLSDEESVVVGGCGN